MQPNRDPAPATAKAGLTGTRPIVSVVMANFNGAPYLADAIGSACRQSLTDIEIIVSDDASTDGSIDIVKGLMANDPRIRLVEAKANAGPAAARNRAILLAKGLWIAVMDSDDLMHPARLETLVTAAKSDGSDIAADDLLIFNSEHIRLPQTLLKGKWARAPFWVDALTYVRLNRIYGAGPILGYLKPLIRTSLLKRLEGPYDETLRIGEDYDLIMRLLLSKVKYRVYPRLHYFYRKHTHSISHRLNEEVLIRAQAAELQLLRASPYMDAEVKRRMAARLRSLSAALTFERILSAAKAGAFLAAARMILAKPSTWHLLRFPVGARLGRLWRGAALPRPPNSKTRPQVCVVSNQRVVGRTNGSSVGLLTLIAALSKSDVDIHFLAPSPATLGRWPFLILSKDVASTFKTYTIRGTWRIGNCIISREPRRLLVGALAAVERQFLEWGFLPRPVFDPSPYSIAPPLSREDQLFIAKNAPCVSDYLIADNCFMTEAFPYALRHDAKSAVIMHDLFSSRRRQFARIGMPVSVADLAEDDERSRLAKANCIVAAQDEEAALVRRWLPQHRVLTALVAANPMPVPQPGDKKVLLFVGSAAAANVDGLHWFITSCWPEIRRLRPDVRCYVAGTVSQNCGRPPTGMKFLGFVDDLARWYKLAGVVISPLRVGSGVKIKLIEALEHGKAVVASPATLQGVGELLAQAVRVADGAAEFVSAVVDLLDDDQLRIELANNGLKILSQHFSAKDFMVRLSMRSCRLSKVSETFGPPAPRRSRYVRERFDYANSMESSCFRRRTWWIWLVTCLQKVGSENK